LDFPRRETLGVVRQDQRKDMKCNERNCISGDMGWKRSGRVSAAVFVWLEACFVCSAARADPLLSHSVLVLDQSAPLRPWSSTIIEAVQSGKSDKSGNPISYHVQHLDLLGFGKRRYDDNLRNHLSDKYKDKRIDVILSIGPAALDLALKL